MTLLRRSARRLLASALWGIGSAGGKCGGCLSLLPCAPGDRKDRAMGRSGQSSRPGVRRARIVIVVLLLMVSVLAVVPFQRAVAAERGNGEVMRRSTAAQPAVGVAATVPPEFQDSTVWSGFTLPSAISFAQSGRVFVAEKSGLIKVFDSTSDTTASTVTDLRTVVHDFWDRGMLGMAVDPQLGTAGHNFLYVLYAYDTTPVAGSTDGCVVQSRLSRIPVDPA